MDDSLDFTSKLIKLSNIESFNIFKKITAYESTTYSTWKTECQYNREFYFGKQWTSDEIDANTNRGQYTITINKTRTAINSIVGLLTASQPKYKAVAAEQNDNNEAHLSNRLLDWVWHRSKGLSTFRKVVKRAARDNIGYFFVEYNRNTADVTFKPLSFDEVIVDPNSRDILFDDAEEIFLYRWVPIEKVKAKFGIEPIVYEQPETWSTLYDSFGSNYKVCKIYSDDKLFVKVYEGYSKFYFNDPKTGATGCRIRKRSVLGFFDIFQEWLPPEMTEYPIIPVIPEDTENPYTKGEVHFLREVQKFINKSHGVALLNAQLNSNPKVFLRETDIPNGDFDEFADNYATPGSVNLLRGNANPPFVVQGQPINNAFFTLYQNAERHFQEASLPMEAFGMMDSGARMDKSQILDVRDAALDKYKDFVSNMEESLSRLGKVVLQVCKAYLKDYRILKIVGADKKIQTIELNKREVVDITNQDSVRRFVEEQRREKVPEDQIASKLEKAKDDQMYAASLSAFVNDDNIANIEEDVFVVSGSYTPSYEMALLRLSMELRQMGVADEQLVLQHAPIEDKKAVMDRLSTIKALQEQVRIMQQRLADAEQYRKITERKLTDADMKMAVNEHDVKLKKIESDERMKSREANRRLQSEIKNILRSANLSVREALLQIKEAAKKQDNELSDEQVEAYLAEIALEP